MSISIHETDIEEGEATLVVVYREETSLEMQSLEGLKYHLTKNIEDWPSHFAEDAMIGSNKTEVVAYSNTPKCLG